MLKESIFELGQLTRVDLPQPLFVADFGEEITYVYRRVVDGSYWYNTGELQNPPPSLIGAEFVPLIGISFTDTGTPPQDNDCTCEYVEEIIKVYLYPSEFALNNGDIPLTAMRPYTVCESPTDPIPTYTLDPEWCPDDLEEWISNQNWNVPVLNGLGETCDCVKRTINVEQTFWITEFDIRNAGVPFKEINILKRTQVCKDPTNPWGDPILDCEDILSALQQSGRYPGIQGLSNVNGLQGLANCRITFDEQYSRM